ncbi:hypothetical protein Poli38472_004086 [Pythium oligandrum]|uniref:HSF-type DNA-binding domain-containing protein n=1 Tax=Pythium oligandrum TaxID=41045 RepID=A0A8K1CMF4_PYTOL|nr:hypothetical protein Poli38472_004086 [Pythium oligandrum]|eukprot:TMW66321.1 hypothetical protein Poli38472_004086 [Pythium oligandrum]
MASSPDKVPDHGSIDSSKLVQVVAAETKTDESQPVDSPTDARSFDHAAKLELAAQEVSAAEQVEDAPAAKPDSSDVNPVKTEVSDLRIQAPESGVSSGVPTSTPGPLTSPVSVLSVPTSPADDGLDTPESEASGAKRRRVESDAAHPHATSPLFLEKTYEMLDKCATHIACWSSAGDSFIVKNPIEFAENVIPSYFKHKNFSSFVRQLNFYGFRKVRVVDPEVTGGVDPKDWWEFRHEKFQRGRKELLKEIKRRSLHANGSSGQSDGRPNIDRGEIEDLRSEVCTLREQIQQLNKHMIGVMQIVMARNQTAPGGPGAPPPVQGMPMMHGMHHPGVMFHPNMPHGYPPHPGHHPGSMPTSKNDKNTPPLGYPLRPVQTLVGHGPGGHVPYMHPPAGGPHPGMDWEAYHRHQYEQHQRFLNPYGVPPPSQSTASTPTATTSVPAVTGLKRSRASPSPAGGMHPGSGPPMAGVPGSIPNPEDAVRHMSMMVTQIRNDLLGCIIGRIIAFIRVQPPHQKAEITPEVNAVADAVNGDILQRLVHINEAEAATHGKPPGSAPSETSLMYRVEILKFVSKELPRAVQESVEKRLPPPVKKAINRSLLALMVQKAQAALENQMRIETASSPGGSNASVK